MTAPVDPSTPPAPGQGGAGANGAPGIRWGLAIVLGLAGAAANLGEATILTEETPIMLFGGIFTLIAFVGLGMRAGILAALLSLTPMLGADAHPAARYGPLVYVVEGAVALLLYRRTHSLALSIALFWFGGGWLWDVAVYRVWVGLDWGYISVLFVKQLLNGLINGLAADLVLRRRVRTWMARRAGRAVSDEALEDFAFQRVVLIAMLPLTILGLLYVRAQYERVIGDVDEEARRAAWEVAAEADAYLGERRRAMLELVRAIRSAGSPNATRAALSAFHERFPEFYVLARTDAAGVVRQASPRTTAAGVPVEGLDIGDRRYFLAVRNAQHPVFGQLIFGRLNMRSAGVSEPAVALAEPLFDADGTFDGILVAGLDPRSVADRVSDPRPGEREITLVDAEGRVIASSLPLRSPGTALEEIVRAPRGAPLTPFPLADLSAPQAIRYYPPASESAQSELAVDLIHGWFHPILRSGWGVLVDTPASSMYPRLTPVALQVVSVVAALLLVLSVAVRRLAARVARPLEQAAAEARRITRGEYGEASHSGREGEWNLVEARDLARSLAVMRDALAKKERRSQERQRDLESQLIQAQKMEAVGLLAGGIAHDFNNLLTPVLGLSELGMLEKDTDTLHEYLEQIRAAATRARDVVRQLLAFSRKQVLATRVVDLGEEVREARELLRPMLKEDIEITLDVPPGAYHVVADPSQVHQVLVNLAVNAQYAMPRGGRLTLELRRESGPGGDASASHLEGRPVVKLVVRDTGYGIAEDTLPHIFEPFFTTKELGKGTGLGLATVYGIVHQHGGTIQAHSTPGQGTVFEVFLPECAPDAARTTGAIEERPTVLLVEEDDEAREFALEALAKAGFEVTMATSAEDALRAGDPGEPCDALVTALALPEMDGAELHARVADQRDGLPVVFTAGPTAPTVQHPLPEGSSVLVRPFAAEELAEAVRSALAGTQAAGRPAGGSRDRPGGTG